MGIYYHGSTADNLKSIKKNGLRENLSGSVWTCSGDLVYLWSADELVKQGEAEEHSKEQDAFQRAFESAQCALAKAKDCRAVVIEVELDGIQDNVEPDESCENMWGAVCVTHVPRKKIKSISISNDLSLFRGYFIGMMMNRDLNNLHFNKIERKIAEKIVDVVYPEDIEDCLTWQNVDLTRGMERV